MFTSGYDEVQILIHGRAGQGVVLLGYLLGKIASECGFNCLQTSSYGAEARAGNSSSEVVISKSEIEFPGVLEADVLVLLSEGFESLLNKCKRDCLIIKTEGVRSPPIGNTIEIPALKISKEIGSPRDVNLVILGFLVKKLGLDKGVSLKILDEMELNKRAFESGYSLLD